MTELEVPNRPPLDGSPAGQHKASSMLRLNYLVNKVPFIQAARDGLIEVVKRHLTNMDTEVEENTSGTIFVQNRGYVKVSSKEEAKSVLLNQLNDDDIGALHYASRYGHLEIMELLIEEGINVELIGSDGAMAPIHFAAKAGQAEAVKKLCEVGSCNANSLDAFGYTALHWACAKGEEDVVTYLLTLGEAIDVNQVDNDGITPLLVACTYGYHNIATRLLDLDKIEVLGKDRDGNNVLHCCCDSNNSYLIAKMILDKVGDEEKTTLLTTPDADGNLPLHSAVMNNLFRHTKLFISSDTEKITINAPGQDGRNVLHFATQRGNKRLLDFLIISHAMIENVDNDQLTPLHVACQYRNSLGIVKTLIRTHKANIEARDKDNFTPLMYAAWKGQVRTVSFLIGCDCNVDAKDAEERTALHYACESNQVECAKLLLSVHPRSRVLKDRDGNDLPFDAIMGLDKFEVDNSFKVDTSTGMFYYNHVESGIAYGETTITTLEGSCEFPLTSIEQPTCFTRFVNEPSVMWGIAWMGFVEVKIHNKTLRIFIPGVGTYDPAGLTGDPHASERIGGDCFCFQVAANVAMIVAARRGATEEQLEQLQAAIEPSIIRYHGRMSLGRFMLHQIVQTMLKGEKVLSYPEFILNEAKEGLVDLGLRERAHSRSFFKNWEMRDRFADSSEDYIQPPPQFFHVSKRKGDEQINIEISDINDNTPLHLACQHGFTTCVIMLLGRQADVTSTNDSDSTPLHICAQYGQQECARILLKWASGNTAEFVGYDTGTTSGEDDNSSSLLEAEDDNSATPMHIAAKHGHKKMIKLLLSEGADIDAADLKQWTPLHWACNAGSFACVRELIDNDANPNDADKRGLTPLHVAAMNNFTEIVTHLLDADADPTMITTQAIAAPQIQTMTRQDTSDQIEEIEETSRNSTGKICGGMNALDLAVEHGASDIARLFCKLDDESWFFDIMSNTKQEDKFTVLGRMIAKMPKAAVMALNRCVVTTGSIEDPDFQLTYRYDLVDQDVPPNKDPNDNTGLELMVKFQREDVMNHPVCRSLLEYKWRNFGRVIFYSNLGMYMLYLFSFTTFVAITPVPSFDESSFPQRSPPEGFDALSRLTHYLTFIVSVVRVMNELSQLVMMGRKYLLDPTNYLEAFLYVSTLVVMAPDLSDPTNPKKEWQWNLIAFTIFLAWVNLVIFIRRVPGLGMYVLMFQDVVVTFAKAAIIFLLFLFAFSLSFFVLLQNANPNFRNFGDALLKTLVMLIGELEYEALFNVNDAFESLLGDECSELIACDAKPSLPNPVATKLLFALFLILMPLLLLNLLVGLAVGDIQEVREKAELMRLSMQTNLVTNIERKMGDGFIRRVLSVWVPERTEYPNKPTRNPLVLLLRFMSSSDMIDSVMDITQGGMKSEREELMEKVDKLKEDVRRLKTILKSVDAARQSHEEFTQLLVRKFKLNNAMDLDDEDDIRDD